MGPGSKAEPVLDAIVATAARLCGAEFALAHLLQNDGRYHTVASNNANAALVKYAVEHPMPPGRGSLTSRTALEGRTIHVDDCLADAEYTFPEFQRIGGFRTMLGVPLLRDGVVIGVLGLLKSVVAPFTDAQIALVTTFADQAVIALQNVRLFEAEQTRTRELQQSFDYQTATNEVLGVISRSPTDAAPVFQAIVDSAARLCESVHSTVLLFDGEMLRVAATHNFNTEAREHFLRIYPRRPDRSQIAARAVLARETLQVADVLADPDYAHAVATAANWRSVLAVPMLRGGEPVGVIGVGKPQPTPFSDRQVGLLKTFADQAVIAIENVRLFEEVQES